MAVYSLRKIANGDIMEQARMLYAIAPRKFQALARQQGIEITNESDVIQLIKDVQRNAVNFSFKRLRNEIPVTQKDLDIAGKSGLKII